MQVFERGAPVVEDRRLHKTIVKSFEGEAQGNSLMNAVESRQLSTNLRGRLAAKMEKPQHPVDYYAAPKVDLLPQLLQLESSVGKMEEAFLVTHSKCTLLELLDESEAILQRLEDKDSQKRVEASLSELSRQLSSVEQCRDEGLIEQDLELLESSCSILTDVSALSSVLVGLKRDMTKLLRAKQNWPRHSALMSSSSSTEEPVVSEEAVASMEARVAEAEELLRTRGVALLDEMEKFEAQVSQAEVLLRPREN